LDRSLSGVVQWAGIVLIGATVGFLGGMFGKGGSAIATPLLAAIGLPAFVAVAAPLPATIPGTLFAHRQYLSAVDLNSHHRRLGQYYPASLEINQSVGSA
jgi:uncharacterized membrane protein YfcA